MGSDLEVKTKLMTDAVRSKMHGADKYYDVYTTMEGDEIIYLIHNVKTDQSIPVYSYEELSEMCKFIMVRCRARKAKKE